MIETRSILLTAFVLVLLLSLAAAGAAFASEPGVEAAQRRLAEIGFDPGPVDGIAGPRTRRAIRAFQKANQLRVSGRLDAKTLNKLFPGKPARASDSGRRLLSYKKLGWRAPQSGEDALSRFRSQTGSLDMKRSAGELIVPDGGGVYVVAAGDTVPGFDCDPRNGRIEMEFMLGPGGPIVFRPLDKKGYCQLGFGILLQVGQRLHMAAADWNGGKIPGGEVEVGRRGLVYVKSD